ncbi:MAG: DMT family transporter [Rhodovibrionaceae bacterium]|nr:DMT family transporter [Rhodovibrionaceae bacterium]
MRHLSDHAKGLIITFTGVLVLTPDALLIRLIGVDHWTIAFWRGVLMFLGLTLAIAVVERGRPTQAFRAIGRAGLVAGAFYGVNSVLFVYAITHTQVANVLVILAASPLFAALMSGLFLREFVRPITWAAILSALLGIALVFWDGLGAGTFEGDFAALCVAFTLAGTFTIMRRAKHVSMVPATALGGIVSALITVALASPVAIFADPLDMFYMALLGFVVIPIAFGLITLGPRYLPAPEVGLIMLLETVLGPLWVWLVIGEAPRPMAFVGGAIVIVTLALHSAIRLRQIKLARHPGEIQVGAATVRLGQPDADRGDEG